MFAKVYSMFAGSSSATQTQPNPVEKEGERDASTLPTAQAAIANSSASAPTSMIPTPADREFELLERSTIGGGVLSVAGFVIAKLAGKNSLAVGAGIFTTLSAFSYLRLQSLRQEGESQIKELKEQISKLQAENGLLKARATTIESSSSRLTGLLGVVTTAVSKWLPSSSPLPNTPDKDAGKQLEALREQFRQFEIKVGSFREDSKELEVKRAAMLKTISEIPPDDSPLTSSTIVSTAAAAAGSSATTKRKGSEDGDYEEIAHHEAVSQPIDEWDIVSKLNPAKPLSKDQLGKITILEEQIREFQEALQSVNAKAAEISADSTKIWESLTDLLLQVSSIPVASE
jgi:TolA-binding protein